MVTGASRGLGFELASALSTRGWWLIVDARDPVGLQAAVARMRRGAPDAPITAIPGDVADPRHRRDLAEAVGALGSLDLLVNNASVLGPSPQPRLDAYPLDVLREVYEVNTLAPVALVQALLGHLRRRSGTVVNVTSDAAIEPYPGWGGYGSSKAALDQLTAILGAEEPDLRVYAVDPGDLRTDLHQRAFPGEDISDRPEPATVVPAFLRLLDARPPSGRLRLADLPVEAAVGGRGGS